MIGVVLTGMLDDGTAGLMAIKRCGGVTVVQDPRDAAYSGMPRERTQHCRRRFLCRYRGCGGVLWEMDTPGEKRFRCHTGHSYTGPALLASQSEKIEEMLWISLRMFEECKNLLTSMAKASRRPGDRNEHRRRANETQGYIDRIRGMLLVPGSDAPPDTLTQVKALMAEPRQAKSTR